MCLVHSWAHEELEGVLFLPVWPLDKQTLQCCCPENPFKYAVPTPRFPPGLLGRGRDMDFKVIMKRKEVRVGGSCEGLPVCRCRGEHLPEAPGTGGVKPRGSPATV